MDLSSIGYASKEFRVIPVHDRSITKDFLAGKFRVLGVECNARASYNSSLQIRLKSIFPQLARHMQTVSPDRNLLGRTIITDVNTYAQSAIIANMFVSTGYGLGRSGTNKSETPVNRFSEKFLSESFADMINILRPRMLNMDKQIAVPRFYGGLGGTEWEDVLRVLDKLCEEHRINILAYLPKDYNQKFVRGAA